MNRLLLTPDQLLPGDRIAVPDWQLVLTKPQRRDQNYYAIGMAGIDTDIVCYFEVDRKIVVDRPEQPLPDAGIEAIRRKEYEFFGYIRNRKW